MAAVAHIFGRAHGSGEIERNGRGNNLLHKMKHLAASHHISACATSVTTEPRTTCRVPVTENLPLWSSRAPEMCKSRRCCGLWRGATPESPVAKVAR